MPHGKSLSQDAVDIIRYIYTTHKLSYSKIGELIGRPTKFVSRIIKKCDPVTGERVLLKKGRRVKTTEEDNLRIRDLALQNPYMGCHALAELYNQTAEKKLSKSSVHRRLKMVGINVVKLPATTEELQDKKQFPKSQNVYKFEMIPEKKKRVMKPKEHVDVEMIPQPLATVDDMEVQEALQDIVANHTLTFAHQY